MDSFKTLFIIHNKGKKGFSLLSIKMLQRKVSLNESLQEYKIMISVQYMYGLKKLQGIFLLVRLFTEIFNNKSKTKFSKPFS